ncbi:metallophosphoesterase family protein [Clostridium thermarum]|uniref:metallophosphoesterase family protein n=1 Tax=Clostridium thermarum TaxID=1716543 RepID=UPI0013D32F38|nr:DNA repair exonuclease [Clostridium thermarum]
MKKVKLIHCSDFHLDTPFMEYPKAMAEKRKEDIRETFLQIMKLADNEKVDIILISGDVFDNSTVTYETITSMKRAFEQIPDIKIFICPGNHDPYTAKSYYNIIPWPTNVHIFKDKLEKVHIEDLNLTVYGCGFGSSYERIGMLKDFFVEDKEKINIMVLHGEVVSGSSVYNPITEDMISKSGLDYLALGHVHSFSGINRCGDTYWSYSGCPEGRGFDELGPKGIVIGEIGKGYTDLSFKETCKRRIEVLRVNISECENYEDISLKIDERLGLHKRETDIGRTYEKLNKDIYKIILEGTVDRNFSINLEVLNDKLKNLFYYVKILDRTETKIDYEELAKEYNIKGVFVRKMLDRISAAEDKDEIRRLRLSLKMGLDALEYREVRTNEN